MFITIMIIIVRLKSPRFVFWKIHCLLSFHLKSLEFFYVLVAVRKYWVILFKILLTAITLGFGFKGGEVTPLFFIGATLGSALSLFLPLPVGLLAGMGFIAVFSAAAKTPIACCFMAIELFGISCGIYVAIACIIAYLVSGRSGIYNFPENKTPRHFLFGSFALFS